jgi:hypothetical protein
MVRWQQIVRDTAYVCWIYHYLEADKIAKLIPGMMPSKWNTLPE